MTKNPILNALAASAYIICIVLALTYAPQALPPGDTIFMPMVFLSLLTFSVAFMAYTFFFEPAKLLLAGEKKEAAALVGKTLLAFGCCVLLFILATFLFPIPQPSNSF